MSVRKVSRATLLLAALPALALTACSNQEDAQQPTSAAAPATTVVQTTTVTRSEDPAPESSASAAPASTAAAASTPAAAAAIEVTSFYPVSPVVSADGKIGIIESPSGNIGCDIWAVEGYATCGVISYAETGKYPHSAGIGPAWVFALNNDSDPIEIVPRGDALLFMIGKSEGHLPQRVDYGTTVRYGSLECTSERDAMTCTNTVSGRGVRMSAEGYRTF